MIVPLFLFVVSGAGVAVALLLPGWSDLLLFAVSCALASLILLIRAIVTRSIRSRWDVIGAERRARPGLFRRLLRPRWVVVDGSNVMHWKDGTPQIETLREVVQLLTALGYAPGVVFDANAGYKISGRYRHDWAFGKLLGLPEARIMVVPKGTPADPQILAAAGHLKARIVTNDRYRDWAVAHPEVNEPGQLIRGGYRDGVLWLDVDA